MLCLLIGPVTNASMVFCQQGLYSSIQTSPGCHSATFIGRTNAHLVEIRTNIYDVEASSIYFVDPFNDLVLVGIPLVERHIMLERKSRSEDQWNTLIHHSRVTKTF